MKLDLFEGVKNKEVKNILKHYYIQNAIMIIIGSCYSPVWIYFQGQLFIPSQLSIIFTITSLFGLFQFLMNKVSTKVSLISTPLINFIFEFAILILLFINIKIYIIVSLIGASMLNLISFHYLGVIQEIIKADIEIQKFSNITGSIHSFFGLIGSGLAIIITKYIAYKVILICCCFIIAFGNIYEYYISRLILKYNNLKGLKNESDY